ncbi:MAG: helix-turn-helix domain-containing protein [Oscillospiraceae bacterium]|jgi:hypothetical protein|nr:helix-turn-helix domain-containing protein [Oscillospiraceae bacterium]
MRVPLSIIQSAQLGNSEAVKYIFEHFEGYIASHSLVWSEEADGVATSFVDEDLRYLAEVALSKAIFKFRVRDVPEGFTA